MPESLSKYHLKRLRKTKASYKKFYSWLSSKRYLADSNCCNRFCRPVPNHSAKVPLLIIEYKDTHFSQYHKIISQKKP